MICGEVVNNMEITVEQEIERFLKEIERKNPKKELAKKEKIDRVEKYFLLEGQKNRIAGKIENLVLEVFISKKVGNREEEKKEISEIRSLQQMTWDLTSFQLDLQCHFTKEEWKKYSKATGKENHGRKEEKHWEIYIQ